MDHAIQMIAWHLNIHQFVWKQELEIKQKMVSGQVIYIGQNLSINPYKHTYKHTLILVYTYI